MNKVSEEVKKRVKEGEERDRKISGDFSKNLLKDYYKDLLTYWEKQLILFTKGHYKTCSNEYLKILVAKEYALPVETLENYTVLHMMTEIHTKLVAAKVAHFDLLSFINGSAKRSEVRNIITIECFINELFAQFQGIKVKADRYELDLGEVDVKLFNEISELLGKDDKNNE